MLRPIVEKTPYELLKGRKPNVKHLRVFGCRCFVHNNGKDNLGKLDPRSDAGTFIGYSSRSKAYKVFNKRTKKVEESVHVVFDEANMGSMPSVDPIPSHISEEKCSHFPLMTLQRKIHKTLLLEVRKTSQLQ